MIRRISSLTAAIAVYLAATTAFAQEASAEATAAVPAVAVAGGSFGQSGQLALSVDRVFGFSHSSTKEEPDAAGAPTTTTSSTEFSLIGRLPPSLYQIPRFGIDYFVMDSLSVGGSLAFMTVSNEAEAESAAGSTTVDLPTVTTFMISPRVGYAIMFSDMFGIWPRGGITYFTRTVKSEQTDPFTGNKIEETDSANGLTLTLEVPLILSPADHIGITLAPSLDFPLTGSRSQERTGQTTVDSDYKTTDFAVNAGILTWF